MFAGQGKKTAWEVWKTFQPLTNALLSLSDMPNHLSDEDFAEVEQCVVLLYSKTCPYSKVNEACQDIFSNGFQLIENIPPTQNALLQHTKRVVLQAGYLWAQTLTPEQLFPLHSNWRWECANQVWQPLWIIIPKASKSCYELIHCGCWCGCCAQCKC